MAANYSRVKEWASSETLTASDLNAEFDNVLDNDEPTLIIDADTDTKIMCEESSDEDKIRFDTGGTQAMMIDDSQRLIVGDTTTRTIGGTSATIQQTGTDEAKSSLSLQRFDVTAGGPILFFGRANSGAIGTYTLVDDNDILGQIAFYGADGEDLASKGANIFARVNGTPGEKDLPTELVFGTTADTASAPTERMTISAAGVVNVVGELTAGTKTFKIDHPLDPDNKILYHMAIEGPRVDLIYRGVATLKDGKATVNLDTDSCTGMTAGTFEALTQNAIVTSLHNQDTFDRIKSSKIINGSFNIECENIRSTDEIAWVVIAERADPFIKSINRTDKDGRLIPEEDKATEEDGEKPKVHLEAYKAISIKEK